MALQILSINGICHGHDPCWHDVTYGETGKRICGPDICAALLKELNWKYLADSGRSDIVNVIKHLGQYVFLPADRARYHRLLTSLYGTKVGVSLVSSVSCEEVHDIMYREYKGKCPNTVGMRKLLSSVVEGYLEIVSTTFQDIGYVYCNTGGSTLVDMILYYPDPGDAGYVKVLAEIGRYHDMTLMYDGPIYSGMRVPPGLILNHGCRLVIVSENQRSAPVIKLRRDDCGALDVDGPRTITSKIYVEPVSVEISKGSDSDSDERYVQYNFKVSMITDLVIIAPTSTKFVLSVWDSCHTFVTYIPCSLLECSETENAASRTKSYHYELVPGGDQLQNAMIACREVHVRLYGIKNTKCLTARIGKLNFMKVAYVDDADLLLPSVNVAAISN